MEAELEVELDEISSMHKFVNKQAKKISLLHSQLEEAKNREVKVAQDDEEEDLKVDWEVTLKEIGSMHMLINKQAMESSLLQSQLEKVKSREVELLNVVQDKYDELAREKHKIGKNLRQDVS